MKAKLVVALLLGTITFQSQFNKECQATLLKTNNKSESDEMEDLVNEALEASLTSKKKKPV
jgi:flagellar biogenesis protein FliO